MPAPKGRVCPAYLRLFQPPFPLPLMRSVLRSLRRRWLESRLESCENLSASVSDPMEQCCTATD